MIRFAELAPDPACVVSIADFHSSSYQPKYGTKPISRYVRTFYPYGDCAGRAHTIVATLSDVTTGSVLSASTVSFTS